MVKEKIEIKKSRVIGGTIPEITIEDNEIKTVINYFPLTGKVSIEQSLKEIPNLLIYFKGDIVTIGED